MRKRKKWNSLSIFLALLPLLTAAGARAGFMFPDSVKTMASVAFSPLDELHVIGVDTDGDRQMRWAAWSENSESGVSVRLALVTKADKGPAVSMVLEKPEAYEPIIARAVNWRYRQHPVLALTYRQGAAAQQLELYGLDEKNQPVLLDERLGEQIDWRIGAHGESLVSLYAKPNGRLTAVCFRWQEKQHKLAKASCQ